MRIAIATLALAALLAGCAGNQAERPEYAVNGRAPFDGTEYDTPSGGLVPGQVKR